MLNFITKTICLTDITKGGVACDCPRIELLTFPDGLAQNCVVANGCFDVQVPDDFEGELCITGYIICDDCAKCPSEPFSICLCNDNTDCPACSQCVDGLCVEYCSDSQFCLNGECVECEQECPNGKVCLNGKCECPLERPYEDAFGNCVTCLDDTVCPACTQCIGGDCLPIDCGTGVCNPETGTCQGCVNSGDCASNTDGRNCCQEDGTCGCCEGYVFDVVQNRCIEKPECTTDSDCPPCSVCIDGFCTPIDCPEGYECDSDTGDCVFNPCPNQPCSNGAECGPDCGCLDGMCTPCVNMPCNQECADALGCECLGADCGPSNGCSGPCITGYDCGEGCTCYEGECVPCSNFPCSPDQCSNRPGCACSGSTCGGDGSGCQDTFEITKIDGSCDLEARLKLNKACPCPSITVGITPTSVLQTNDYNATLQISLHKGSGSFSSLPKLGDTNNGSIAQNERPEVGSICMDLEISYDVIENGVKTGQGTVIQSNVGGTLSFANADTVNSNSFLIPKIGSTLGTNEIVSAVFLKVKQCGNFRFPNGCVYSDLETIYTYSISGDNWASAQQGEINTDDSRYPRFTWYRSEDNVFGASEIIRDLYIQPIGGLYSDALYGPDLWTPLSKQSLNSPEGLLISNRYYQVVNDCSCSPIVASELLHFCENDIQSLTEPTISQCGRRLTLVGNPQVCVVNQDLSQFTDVDGSTYDQADSTRWNLYINGDLIDTFSHRKESNQLETDGGLQFSGYVHNSVDPITSVAIEQNEGNCRVEFSFENADLIPIIETNCETTNGTVTARFLRSGYEGSTVLLSTVTIDGEAYTVDGDYYVFSNLSSDVVYNYTATFTNDCIYEGSFTDTCCQSPLFVSGYRCTDGLATLTITPQVQGLSITVTDGFDIMTGAGGVYSDLSPGTYTITASLNATCVEEEIIEITCCEAGNITMSSISPSPFCNDDGAVATINGTPGVEFGFGFISIAAVPVLGNVEVCNPIAQNLVIPASGTIDVAIPAGIYDLVTNLQGGPTTFTFGFCGASNPTANCEVTQIVDRLSVNVYPSIVITNENIVCSEDGLEWTLTFNTQNAEEATASVGNLSFVGGVVTVTNIPSGTSTTVTLEGQDDICITEYVNSTVCNCTPPAAPIMDGDTIFCPLDSITAQTATNASVGWELQVSTDQVNWTGLGASLSYTPPSIGTYFFRYFITATNCPGPVTTVILTLDNTPSVVSSSIIDNCDKIQLTLSANHIVNTPAVLYNSSNCAGSGTSLVNPTIAANIVTYVVPAGVNLDSTDWSVQYGECSCHILDTITPGCGVDCDCVVELREDPDNNCNLELEMNGSGCGSYELIEIRDEADDLVFTANNPTDNYLETIGEDGTFPSLIPLVDAEIYTATVSGTGCSSKVAQHQLECTCEATPVFAYDGAGGECDGTGMCPGDADFVVISTDCGVPNCADTFYDFNVTGVPTAAFDSVTLTSIQGPGNVSLNTNNNTVVRLSLDIPSSFSDCASADIVRIDYYTCGDIISPTASFTVMFMGC